MDGLLSLLLFAGLFFLMMRFGCGSHKAHGHSEINRDSKNGNQNEPNQKHVDPVCGMDVDVDQGYGLMFRGRLYRFCHRNCLDKFEANPKSYLETDKEAHVQGGR